MSFSSSLLVNTASGHGLMRWLDDSNSWDNLNKLIGSESFQPNCQNGLQYKTLLYSAAWFLKCIGVLEHLNLFRQGWNKSADFQALDINPFTLGALCHRSPDLLTASLESSQEQLANHAAMFYCYRKLLMHPTTIGVGIGVDDYVDDRLSDLQLSEKVYQYNYQKIIHKNIMKWAEDNPLPDPIVIIDIGAGNGNVLLDVALMLDELGFNCICIAVDPSIVSRRAASALFSHYPKFQFYAVDGSVEQPGFVIEFLNSKQIPTSSCLLIAKSSFHDRSFSQSDLNFHNISDQHISVGDYVYRDNEWKILQATCLSQHLTLILNRWCSAFQNSLLVLMETHLIASENIQTYLSNIPILPGYLSHSLSAQYLLPYNNHLDAVLKTDFSVIQEHPLHSIGRDHLMSLIVAKS